MPIEEPLEAQCRLVWDLNTLRGQVLGEPLIFMSLFPMAPPHSHGKGQRKKSPPVTDREKGKETILIYSQRVLFFVLSNEGKLSKKIILPKPYLTWRRAMNWLQPPLVFLSHLRGEMLRKTCEGNSPPVQTH